MKRVLRPSVSANVIDGDANDPVCSMHKKTPTPLKVFFFLPENGERAPEFLPAHVENVKLFLDLSIRFLFTLTGLLNK